MQKTNHISNTKVLKLTFIEILFKTLNMIALKPYSRNNNKFHKNSIHVESITICSRCTGHSVQIYPSKRKGLLWKLTKL